MGTGIDPTPSLRSPQFLGGTHPLTNVRRKVVSIFRKIGFTVSEATEVETEWFCFDALNTPKTIPPEMLKIRFSFLQIPNGVMFAGKPMRHICFELTPFRSNPNPSEGETTP